MPFSLSDSVISDKLQTQSSQVQGKPIKANLSCGLYKSSSALVPDCSSQAQSSWHVLCMKSRSFLSTDEIQQYPKGYQQPHSRAYYLSNKQRPSSTSPHLHEGGWIKCPNSQPWGFSNKSMYFQLLFSFPSGNLQPVCECNVNF